MRNIHINNNISDSMNFLLNYVLKQITSIIYLQFFIFSEGAALYVERNQTKNAHSTIFFDKLLIISNMDLWNPLSVEIWCIQTGTALKNKVR